MFRAHQNKRTGLFLTLITVSLFALANTDLDSAKATLTKALQNWDAFTPESYREEELSFDDTRALLKQQKLNKTARDAALPFLRELEEHVPEQLDTLSGINAVTNNVLDEKKWPKDERTPIRKNGNANKILKVLDNKHGKNNESLSPDESQSGGKSSLPNTTTSATPTGESYLAELTERLDERKLALLKRKDKSYVSDLTLKTERLDFDKDFIIKILSSPPDYSDALNLFASRLTAANQIPDNFDALYAELMLLHLYLRPTHGFRLIHLGLRREGVMAYTSSDDQRHEQKANIELSRNLLKLTTPHIANLPQSLSAENTGMQNLSMALEIVIRDRAANLLTFETTNTAAPTAVALIAVLFDLYSYQPSANTASALAASVDKLGLLWDFRTCWYTRAMPSEERSGACFEILKNTKIKDIAGTINGEITSQRPYLLNMQNDHVAHQWSYGAAAIRMMTESPVIKWRKEK